MYQYDNCNNNNRIVIKRLILSNLLQICFQQTETQQQQTKTQSQKQVIYNTFNDIVKSNIKSALDIQSLMHFPTSSRINS